MKLRPESSEPRQSEQTSVMRIAALPTLRPILKALLPVTTLFVLVVYFSIRAPSFLSLENLNVMSQSFGPLLMACIGATFVIMLGSIDLSVGSIALLTAAVEARILTGTHLAIGVAIILGLLVGALCGALNGLVHAYGRVPSFITTLGSLSIFAGIGLIIINGSPLTITSTSFSDFAIGHIIPNVGNAALWAVVILILAFALERRFRFGHYIYAIGGGERVARIAGVRVDRFKTYAFVLSGLTAGFSGVLSAGQLGSAGPSLGSTLLLESLAAIVLGGTSLSGGIGGVERTLLGAVIIVVLADGLNQLGVGVFTQQVIEGAVIIIAVFIANIQKRKMIVK